MRIRLETQSWCRVCARRLPIGEEAEWTRGLRGVECLACAPHTIPPGVDIGPDPLAGTAQEPCLRVLLACERAIVNNAALQMTPELLTAWDRYQKCKALALRADTDAEARAALRQAVLEAIRLAL